MDAQEQAKISAISKKPNVRFAATDDPPPDRVQPILDGLQKVLQTVLDNQNRSPEANVGEKVPGNGGFKKGKGKDNRAQSPSNSDVSRGRPNEAPAARSRDDNQLSRWNEGRQGNQYNRSSFADSQARGPRWNSGSPPGAMDSCPRGQEDRPFQRGCHVCGRPGCHSSYHQNDHPPSQTSPPAVPDQKLEPVLRVRDRFIPWQGYDGCF